MTSLAEVLTFMAPLGLALLFLALLVVVLYSLLKLTRRLLQRSDKGFVAVDEALELSRRTASAQEETNRLLAEVVEELRAGRSRAPE